jgi:hypothetical protein
MRFLIAVGLLAARICTATVNASCAGSGGDWSSESTWTDGYIPGNMDTIDLPNGCTITVSDDRTIGASGANGSIAITLNDTGKIVIANGGALHVRGNTTFTGSALHVSVEAGGTWEFDSSGASARSSTFYTFGPVNNWIYGTFQVLGSSVLHAVVRSRSGGGNGEFVNNGTNSGINFQAAYTDFVGIGDMFRAGWNITYNTNHAVQWNVTHSTFLRCGIIAGSPSGVGVEPGGTFVHNYNIHSSSLGSEIFHLWLTDNAMTGNGTREIRNNIFDKPLAQTVFYPAAFTISGNYFGDAAVFGGPRPWTLFASNFMRYSDYWGVNGATTPTAGDMKDSYLFVDSDWGNPHVMFAPSNGAAASLRGIVFGQGGTALGPPGPKDSGELFFLSDSSTRQEFGVYNSIMLPNMSGYSSLEIGSMLTAYPNVLAVTEHNTWFGGWGKGGAAGQAGFPAMQVGEGGNGVAGRVSSFRINILWNPEVPGYQAGFFKLADVSYASGPTVDYCAPANCDYNTGYNHTLVDAAHPQYTNQGRGYAAAFSSAPGQHDVDVNPMFADWRRTIELFDSKYLGNRPAWWSAGTTYAIGDFVRNSRSDIYWGLPVNYRYINGAGCGGTNPEPGAGTNWRLCWEWASLYWLRSAIVAGSTYTDGALVVPGDPSCAAGAQLQPAMAVMCWIRRGYAVGNAAAWKGHDGANIGAVPSSSLSHGLGLGLP